MWRPLVDVRDVSDAMIAAYEAPAEKVRGEIFNVLHSNYQIRELAMIVAGSVQLTGREVELEEAPAPKLTRDYECSNAKLSTTLGFIPRRSVLEAVTDLLGRIDHEDRPSSPTPPLTTSAGSNCSTRSSPGSTASSRPVKALITGGGGQLASDLEELLGDDARSFTHAELDIADPRRRSTAPSPRSGPTSSSTAPPSTTSTSARPRPTGLGRVNVRAVRDLARRGAKLVHLSTNYVFDGRRDEPYGEDDLPAPRSIYALTKLAGEYAALAYGDAALVVRGAGLYGLHGSASKGGNFVQRMLARAREQGALKMVADQRLQPTFTADLAAALIEAVEAGAEGVLHLTAGGACSWFEFTEAIMELAGIEVPIEAVETTIPPGGADAAAERRPRPAASRRARPGAAAGLARGARRLHGEGRSERHRKRVRKAGRSCADSRPS